jgi:hypothetical protein
MFLNTTTISITNISLAFPVGLHVTGYSAGTTPYWTPTSYANIGGGNITWQNTSDYSLQLLNLDAGRVNGGNVATRPSAGVLSGWLGTITIYYL